jgi:hypothetical protein
MMLACPAFKLAINLIRDTPPLINGEIIEKLHRVTTQDTLAAVRNSTAIPGGAALWILEEMYAVAARLHSFQKRIPKTRGGTNARNCYIFRYAVAMRRFGALVGEKWRHVQDQARKTQ